jgi:hypothetical protein
MTKAGSKRATPGKPDERWSLQRAPRHETVVASVCWQREKLFYIVLVRRSDAALAFLDVPEDLRAALRRFNVAAVVENGEVLRATVVNALPMVTFQGDGDIGLVPVRDGATPAALGMVRHFKSGAYGVDIGEFELVLAPPWLM